MKKILITLFSLLILGVQPVFAQYNPTCPSIYGAPCPTGNLQINKTVKNPQTGVFVDALGANDPTFLPNQEVDFRISVTNAGNSDLSGVAVKDQFPNFVNFLSGPGSFDNNSKTLNWNIGTLKAGETQTFQVAGKVVDSNSIPNTGITCVTNSSTAQQGQMSAQDTATFCIQTQILGVAKQLPVTGPKETTIVLGGSLILLLLSALLYRKSLRI